MKRTDRIEERSTFADHINAENQKKIKHMRSLPDKTLLNLYQRLLELGAHHSANGDNYVGTKRQLEITERLVESSKEVIEDLTYL